MSFDQNVASDLALTDDVRAFEKAIRRIVRAHDLQSRALVKASGLTSAQLTILKGVAEMGEVTSSALSEYADISAATTVTVLDNLEARGLVARYRSGRDRRIVHVRLTDLGRASLANVPPALDGTFIERFASLSPDERRSALDAATQVAELMSRPNVTKPETFIETI